MKKNIKNTLLIILFFVSNLMLAQPNPDDTPDNTNPTDAPIDGYIYFLGIMAILLSYYFFMKIKNRELK